MFLTIIVFILILGLLIFVHEFGHFVVAKRAGVKVEEFGFGFPPRIFGVKRGETIYSLNLLPIGGFVRIYGESGPEKKKKKKRRVKKFGSQTPKGSLTPRKKRAFYQQTAGSRAKILVAGVAMNLLLAAALLTVGHWLGLPTAINDEQVNGLKDVKVQITQVASDSPAEQAGLQMGDAIVVFRESTGFFANAQNDIVVTKVSQVQEFINQHQGEEITLVIQRGSEIFDKKIVPRIEPPAGEGPLGVALVRTAIVSYPWYQSLVKGFSSMISLTWSMIVVLLSLLWQLIRTGQLAVEIAGPVGIFNLTGQAAQLGLIYVLQLAALLSINLAIINAFPFPALDGGRLLFIAIEKIKGSPVSQRIEKIAHTAGFVILILLMLAVTWQDVARLF